MFDSFVIKGLMKLYTGDIFICYMTEENPVS